MAEMQSNARLRADAGLPTSGVIHVRTRLTADFTVIANALAQRRGSAVTVGVATYILSLPDGAPVTIGALCQHFTEGEILISRALRDLESAGYLERRLERQATGVIRTRTFFYDVPGSGERLVLPRPRKQPEQESRAVAPAALAEPAPVPPAQPSHEPAHEPAHEPEPDPVPGSSQAPAAPAAPEAEDVPDTGPPDSPDSPASPAPPAAAESQAFAILASLRLRDRRLILSDREVARLAPRVNDWLGRGTGPEEITGMLIADLPDRFLARPARILAYRLDDLPAAMPTQPAVPATAPVPNGPAVLPWQTCDGGCERAFRAAEPGLCRDCRADADTPTAGQVITDSIRLRQAC